MKKTSNTIVCAECGGTNIETKAWVDVHTDKVLDSCSDGEDEDNWCRDCERHLKFTTYKEFKEEKK